jgi:hypothetical protein
MAEADFLARLFPLLKDQSTVIVVTTLVEFGGFPNHF